MTNQATSDNESAEPGDPCPDPECNGVLDVGHPENCSCHISAPCSACENAGCICDTCGFDTAAEWKAARSDDLEREAEKRGKSWRDGGINRTGETTGTRVDNPLNSTPFSICCGVASMGERCEMCNAKITYHDDGLSARRREVGPGACLMCGKKRLKKGEPFGTAGTCVC